MVTPALLRRLYDWVMNLAHRPNAEIWLAVVSFAESSFFPIPPDVMLVPMVLANRQRAFRIATICLAASVAGGMVGYAIGYGLYETVGSWLVSIYGMQDGIAEFQAMFDRYGLWVILIKGLTPIPYKIVTIASGVAAFSFPTFVLASIVTRGARFFLVAGLLYRYGEPIRNFIEQRLTLVTTLFVVALVGGFVVLEFVF